MPHDLQTVQVCQDQLRRFDESPLARIVPTLLRYRLFRAMRRAEVPKLAGQEVAGISEVSRSKDENSQINTERKLHRIATASLSPCRMVLYRPVGLELSRTTELQS
ncbi:MAG: hypothetical protein JWM11_4989 [Planctomycetaceae bacterium]|nr:hypothetical protein [Planctomycetaceae bacterium]